MTIRVGIINQNLRQHKPRGVARVARAITERLADHPAGFDLYAISSPYLEMGDMMAGAFPLQKYLDGVPLNLTQASKQTRTPWRYYIYGLFGAWLLLPGPLKMIRAFASSFGVFDSARAAYRRLRQIREQTTISGSLDATLLEQNIEREEVRIDSFDVIVSFETYEQLWDWPVEHCESRTICVVHDTIPLRINEGPHGRPDHFLRSMAKSALRADALVCNSQSTLHDLEKFFPSSVGKARTVLLGHDIERFTVESTSAERRSRGRLLMVGDIDRRKNLEGVLHALPHLRRMLPDVHLELVIVGNPDSQAHFSQQVRRAEEYASIQWTGYLDDAALARQYQEADVFVFPSLWEGFGIPVLEAMSAGLPVACADLSSLPEIGGDCASYFDPYDPVSIAEAIRAILTLSETARGNRVEKAQQWAASFTWERTADQMTAVILELARAGEAIPKSRTYANGKK